MIRSARRAMPCWRGSASAVRCAIRISIGPPSARTDMASWVRAQRQASLAQAIEHQRTHAHREGRMLLSNERRPVDRVYTLECIECGAMIARYRWMRAGEGWELMMTWHVAENAA